MEGYEKVIPGSGKFIIETFQSQTHHRQQLETKALEGELTEKRTGQRWGGILATLAILASTYAAVNGAEGFAKILGGTTILGLATAFIYGRKRAVNPNNQQ